MGTLRFAHPTAVCGAGGRGKRGSYNEDEMDTRPQDMLVRELEAVLGRRVDALERENERLKRFGTIAMGVGALMLLITTVMLISIRVNAGQVQEVVEANRFVLRDGDGHIRALIGVNQDNSSRLVLQDRDGRERLRLTLLADGSPGVSFTDREGKSRAVLGLLPDETATLVFADRWGKTRAVLGLSPDESSTLVFADRNGETRVGVGVEADGSAGVTLYENEPARPAPAVDAETPAEVPTEADAAEPTTQAQANRSRARS
jgi:hypothetical protein